MVSFIKANNYFRPFSVKPRGLVPEVVQIPAHHPLYNKEDFIKFTKHIKEIGDIVGNSTDIEKCILLLKEARGSELSEWDIEDIRGFVSHNKKLKELV
ncbi:MAG: hypothetical protein ACRC30_06920 [Clostridium sp.]